MSALYLCPACPDPLPEVLTLEVWAAPCPECGKPHAARPGRSGAGLDHACCEVTVPYRFDHRVCLMHHLTVQPSEVLV